LARPVSAQSIWMGRGQPNRKKKRKERSWAFYQPKLIELSLGSGPNPTLKKRKWRRLLGY